MTFIAKPVRRKIAAPSGIIRDGLVLRWPFDEGSGTTAFDDSGNNHNGILRNLVPGSWVPGFQGTALYFSSNPDESVYNQNDLDVTGFSALSICLFIKNENPTPDTTYFFSLPHAGTQVGNSFAIIGGNLVYYHRTVNGIIQLTDGPIAADSFWRSYIGTYDGSVARFYIDGTEVDQNPSTGTILHDSSYGFTIGSFTYWLTAFSARDQTLDDPRIYNRALTPAECAQIAAGTG